MKQVVVITGLADGMGRVAAVKLARTGCSVAGLDIDEEKLSTLKNELLEIGGDHLLEHFDITNREKITQFRDQVLEKYGHVDTVLSNVGIGFFSPFEEADLEKALKCLEINVIGAAAIFQAFIPSMRERSRGKLVAMSSLVGRIPFPFESIYTASKFAITGLMQSIKFEVEHFGINVALIEPAQVSTGFAAKIHVLPSEGSPYRERVKRFIKRDEDLIKTAPTPDYAADKIVKVILTDKPPLFNQIDFQSKFFLWLNQFLPRKLRDAILVNHMDIKV
jgi:short-subunit dehydrogenase